MLTFLVLPVNRYSALGEINALWNRCRGKHERWHAQPVCTHIEHLVCDTEQAVRAAWMSGHERARNINYP